MIEKFHVNMKDYTTFRCGGEAKRLVICESVSELQQELETLKKNNASYLMLGNGSNTLFTDGGYDGTVIVLGSAFEEIEQLSETEIRCGAAALMSTSARAMQQAGLSGFEPLSGIPGSIGGALFMNAGAYDGEMKQVVKSAQILREETMQVETVALASMDLGYRHSAFQGTKDIILSVTFQLTKDDPENIQERMKDFMQRRNSKQPVQYPSAGSFFKRPEGYFAGKLIQDAGLKGIAVGGAQVSDMHAGFVINRGDATATDIIQLMHLVQNTVMDQFGVKLETEVRIVGN